MLFLFAFSLFISALLLFWIEPMYAKMILPLLGGSPSVWSVCLVFYQAVLLLGYLYAHLITKRFGMRQQVVVHLSLLWLTLITLPIAIPEGWTQSMESSPIRGLSMLLLISVGMPFFILSTTAPLLQRWFAFTRHPWSRDPYFLYSISNLGSIIALFGFPILAEPILTLAQQAKGWSLGYVVLAGLISICGMILLRSSGLISQNRNLGTEAESQGPTFASGSHDTLNIRQRIRWVLLSFAPSSLLLGVTNYITTDIAAVPLLWILPLALYLITFILVFAPKAVVNHKAMVWLQPFVLLPLIVLMSFFKGSNAMQWFFIPLHLFSFFVTSMVCHGELANSRPSTLHLTEFYLWLSFGGVLGGIFNALAAPLVFNSLAEYPLVMILSFFLRPRLESDKENLRERRRDLILPLIFTAILGGLTFSVSPFGHELYRQFLEGSPKMGVVLIAIIFSSLGVVLYSFSRRPLRFGLGAGGFILAFSIWGGGQNQVLYSERSFFGVIKVENNPNAGLNLLFHGTTLHGAQNLDPSHRREPLTYFHRTGPLGQIFEAFSLRKGRKQVAVIGLGTGSMAGYAEPDHHWTFYEIDPAVEKIARNPRYFTFLTDCPAKVDVVLGDGRISLTKASDFQYDLIIIDAFSSDGIPVHLLTREAINLYLKKLAKNGILAFHISNRYLNLQPILGTLAGDSGLACFVREDRKIDKAQEKIKKTGSIWAVMAHRVADLGKIGKDDRWTPLQIDPEARVWTDDFSNIMSVFIWSSSEK
jgi:hypothetical protein